jgi:SAM-dependent methyltransferase
MTDDRAAQIRMWSIGDYPAIAHHLRPISEAAVATLDVQPGEHVLDIAVGDGNAAILAAQRGAVVTGVDLTPAQIDRARDRCAAEGVHVDLRVGDVQELDLPDAGFDVVLSVMGMIFAPRHAAAAREMGRVCRPGGRIAATSWSNAGWGQRWRAALAELLPAPPPGPSPDQWGDPDVALMRLHAAGLDATVEEHDFRWRFPSVEVAVETLVTASGPFVQLMEVMRDQGTEEAAHAALTAAMREANVATDGTCELPAPYLLMLATR